MLDGVNEEKILNAIRQGVSDAMWKAITQAAPGNNLFGDINKAVSDGVKKAMPTDSDIKEAISDGIAKSMPWPSEIKDAIYFGTIKANGGEAAC